MEWKPNKTNSFTMQTQTAQNLQHMIDQKPIKSTTIQAKFDSNGMLLKNLYYRVNKIATKSATTFTNAIVTDPLTLTYRCKVVDCANQQLINPVACAIDCN